jgi:hypothetical protein
MSVPFPKGGVFHDHYRLFDLNGELDREISFLILEGLDECPVIQYILNLIHRKDSSPIGELPNHYANNLVISGAEVFADLILDDDVLNDDVVDRHPFILGKGNEFVHGGCSSRQGRFECQDVMTCNLSRGGGR